VNAVTNVIAVIGAGSTGRAIGRRVHVCWNMIFTKRSPIARMISSSSIYPGLSRGLMVSDLIVIPGSVDFVLADIDH
jgi:hypothetical protein